MLVVLPLAPGFGLAVGQGPFSFLVSSPSLGPAGAHLVDQLVASAAKLLAEQIEHPPDLLVPRPIEPALQQFLHRPERVLWVPQGGPPFRPTRQRSREVCKNALAMSSQFCKGVLAWYSGAAMGSRKKDPHAVALGRKGGKRGGKARWEGIPPEKRSELARKAALARWRKKPS